MVSTSLTERPRRPGFQTTRAPPGAPVAEGGGEARAVRRSRAGADLLGADPGAPGCRQGILLELGVLGAGADAGQADEVALPGGKIGNDEGGGVTAVRITPLLPQNRLTTSGVPGQFLDGF